MCNMCVSSCLFIQFENDTITKKEIERQFACLPMVAVHV